MNSYTGKEMEERCQITRKALRYYEEQGLIHPERNHKHVIYYENDITRIQCIQYYKGVGLSIKDIKKIIDQTTTNECIKEMLTHARQQLDDTINQKQKQIQCMDHIIENLHDYPDIQINDYETLLSLKVRSMIVDTMMIPIKIGGVYVIRDIICTKKEYHLLCWLVRFCAFVLTITFFAILIMALRGNLYE